MVAPFINSRVNLRVLIIGHWLLRPEFEKSYNFNLEQNQ
jgi:hypothetical protein